MAYPQSESAKWAIANSDLLGKYEDGKDKALAEAASRGFPMAPGATLNAILEAGQAVKGKLTEVNGKIYEERRTTLFQQEEFAMKVIVQLGKLGMELYREELLNALAIEQAENAALRDTGRADVERMVTEVEARQVSIIRDRAEAERRITVYKAQLVAAEAVTMTSERALIEAQLATATKKLEIIDSIYQVLAAEELVLVAENRRALTLEELLVAQRVVADIKKTMIPFIAQKATAKQDLAAAITQEIPIQKSIVELGYDRIALKNAEEAAAHTEREAQEALELAKLAWTRANKITEFARTQSRRLLQEYANIIQAEILAKKKSLAEDGIDFKLDSSLARQAIGVNNDVVLSGHEVTNLTEELHSIKQNLKNRAADEADKVRASGQTTTYTSSWPWLHREITGG